MSSSIVSNNYDSRLAGFAGPGGLSGNFFFFILPYVYVVLSIHWGRLRTPIPYLFWACVIWDFFGRMSYANNPPQIVLGSLVAGFANLLGPGLFLMSSMYFCNLWDHSKGFKWVLTTLKSYAGDHPIAQVMLIGYAFAILVEGLFSGAASYQYTIPFLIQLGHSPYDALLFGLAINGFVSPFGAQTLHMNLGFASLGLSDQTLARIAFKITVAGGIAQLVLIPYMLSRIVRLKDIYKSLPFIYVSVLSCVLPYIGIAWIRYEYPALSGGVLSLVVTSIMAKYKWGLNKDYENINCEHSQARQNFLRYYRYQLMRDFKIKHINTANELIQRVLEKVKVGLDSCSHDLRSRYISKLTRSQLFQTAQKSRSIYQIIQEIGHENLKDELAAVRRMNVTGELEDSANVENITKKNIYTTEAGAHLEPMSKRGAQERLTTEIYQLEQQVKDVQARKEKLDRELEMEAESKKALSKKAFTKRAFSFRGVQTGESMKDMNKFNVKERVFEPIVYTFPIWGIILCTFLVRTPQIGALGLFRQTTPYFELSFGSLMDLKVSHTIFLQFQRLCDRPDVFFNIPLLGFPFIFPFVVCSFVLMVLYGVTGIQNPLKVAKSATFPTLVFIQNLFPSIIPGVLFNRVSNIGGSYAPTYAIGLAFAESFKKGAIIVPLLVGFAIGPVMAVQIVAILWLSPMTNTMAIAANIDQTSMFAILVIGVQAATSANFIMTNICKRFAQIPDLTYFKVFTEQWVCYTTMLIIGLVVQVLFAYG